MNPLAGFMIYTTSTARTHRKFSLKIFLMIFRNYNFRNIFIALCSSFNYCKCSFRHLYVVSFKTCLIKKIFAHKLKPTIIVIWAAYIKLVAYHHFIKGLQDCLEYFNENKCAIYIYIYIYIYIHFKLFIPSFILH